MARVATINGVPVYSDKTMSGVNGTRVTFTDGSWCDVRTGKVHNRGKGYISIDTDAGSDSQPVTKGPERVSASALHLRGLAADVQVEVHAGNDIEYTIVGPENQVEAIRANVRGTTLIIEGDGSGSSSGVTIMGNAGDVVVQTGRGGFVGGNVTVRGGGVVIGGGGSVRNFFGNGDVTSVITGSGGGESELQITVKVPLTTSVNSDHVSGKVVIGDTEGPLSASVSTSHSVRAGRVTTAQLHVSSSGYIRVKRAEGAVMAQASSSGEIRVDDGIMPSLTAQASSSGNVRVGGTATSAMLSASSSGNVDVDRVQQEPMVSESSSGRVRVRRTGGPL